MSIDEPIRIVVADDHPVVRGGLVALLRTIPGLEVVGEAADGDEAVRAAAELAPDLVLMDVRMPGRDGIAATRLIRERSPRCRVLILTMYDDDATVFTAMKAGAQGYLLKEAEQDDIVRAVRGVVAGEAIFGPGVATKMLGYFADPPPSVVDADPFPELTEREREILDLLLLGRNHLEIGAALGISPRTSKFHQGNVLEKLGADSRLDLMRLFL